MKLKQLVSSVLNISHSPLYGATRRIVVPTALVLLALSTASSTFAGSATWKTSPSSGDWNTAANWLPMTVPNGVSDTATFASSSTTNVSLSANIEVDGIVFDASASAFMIGTGPRVLVLTGAGIVNNSGITQNFSVLLGNGDIIRFRNSATAGNETTFTTSSTSPFTGGKIAFDDFSSAGGGTFTNDSSPNGSVATSGATVFHDNSSAANGAFINNGGAGSGAAGGFMRFDGRSAAGEGTLVNNGGKVSGAGGGDLRFIGHATAGKAKLIANGGVIAGAFGGRILFEGAVRGSTARVEVFGNAMGDFTDGNLDISGHSREGMTIGSIAGNGTVFLGAKRLSVGSNNLSTTFSGVIRDGGVRFGTGGSLRKIGSGTLILSHANTYTGGTTIERGELVVDNTSGSATGSGPVQVKQGRLGGRGIIGATVIVGSGNGRALLSPGTDTDSLGILTIEGQLTFSNSDASYEFGLNSGNARADRVVANGVTISGAQFSFTDFGRGTLPSGTVFTLIKDTASTPIMGTFTNLADGLSFTTNGNKYKANYEGGDGNDLTLTVQ